MPSSEKSTSTTFSKIWTLAFKFRYYLLFISLMAMLILPAFTQGRQEGLVWIVTRTFMLVAFVNVLRAFQHSMVWIVLLALLAITSEWLGFFGQDSNYTRLTGFLLYCFFVIMISVEVFRKIIISRKIDMHIIVGAFCGFMLIGIIASLIFTLLHLNNPQSFSNVAPDVSAVEDLFYFSFITILTIGYGDIAPITDEARSISLFFGLIGQFYLVVIMAVLVGKFIGGVESKA